MSKGKQTRLLQLLKIDIRIDLFKKIETILHWIETTGLILIDPQMID